MGEGESTTSVQRKSGPLKRVALLPAQQEAGVCIVDANNPSQMI
jgi:hypothetical protein